MMKVFRLCFVEPEYLSKFLNRCIDHSLSNSWESESNSLVHWVLHPPESRGSSSHGGSADLRYIWNIQVFTRAGHAARISGNTQDLRVSSVKHSRHFHSVTLIINKTLSLSDTLITYRKQNTLTVRTGVNIYLHCKAGFKVGYFEQKICGLEFLTQSK